MAPIGVRIIRGEPKDHETGLIELIGLSDRQIPAHDCNEHAVSAASSTARKHAFFRANFAVVLSLDAVGMNG